MVSFLDLCIASGTTGKITTGNGKSIFKLTIKNRPYVSAYRKTTKEPYLTLASEIQYGVSFVCYDTYNHNDYDFRIHVLLSSV